MNMSRRSAAAVVASALIFPSVSDAQIKSVRVGWTPSADVPQIAVSNEQNLWKANGIDARVTPFPSGREALEALIGGGIDVAVIAEFPAVTAGLRGQPIVALCDISRYRANRIVTTTDAPTWQSLAGKKIGVTVGTNAQFQLETAMASEKVGATLVNAAPFDLLPTLMRKDIDAAAMFPAFVPRSREALGNRYKELATPSYVTHFLVVASEPFVRANPQLVDSVLATMLAADDVIERQPRAAQEAVVKSTSGALKLATIEANWRDYEFRTVMQDDLPKLMQEEGKWILAKGLVKTTTTTAAAVGAVLKPEYLKKLAPQRVTLK